MWRLKGHKKRANNQKVSKLTLADVKQTLFDIPSCKFKIPRPDQNFYEDQKGPRVLKGKVSNAYHANTSSASSPLVSKCGDTDPWNSWGWRWDGPHLWIVSVNIMFNVSSLTYHRTRNLLYGRWLHKTLIKVCNCFPKVVNEQKVTLHIFSCESYKCQISTLFCNSYLCNQCVLNFYHFNAASLSPK